MNVLTYRSTVTKVCIIDSLPDWMQAALEGRQIAAIKALREASFSHTGGGDSISLLHAKNIVEDFVQHILEHQE